MIAGGDEVARSQRGNNNCYCQDNELTWFDWELDAPRRRLRDFTSLLIHFRRAHPNLHRRKFFQDRTIHQEGKSIVEQDIAWFNTDGNQVPDNVWDTEWNKSIGVLLNGQTLQVTDDEGHPVTDDSFFMIINAAPDGVEFVLPPSPTGGKWCRVIDTEDIEHPFAHQDPGAKTIIGGRSLMLFSDAAKPDA